MLPAVNPILVVLRHLNRTLPKAHRADELVRTGTMTPEVLGAVRAAIEKNENILISGRDHYRQDDGAERARGVPAAE